MTAPRDELVLCSATLFEDPVQAGPDALAVQVEAARAAGFSGISLWALHAAAAESAGRSSADVRETVLGSGLTVPIVEAVLPWDELDLAAALAAAEPIFELATAYGARYVIAVSMSPGFPPHDEAASRLRAVCQRAADHGLALAVEFLPWSGIADLASAWRLVASAGCSNLGIMIDCWHWQRQPGGPCPDVLSEIPPEFLPILQLSDAAATPDGDPLAECMRSRPLPGEGAVDIAGLLAVLREMGASPIVAPEVFNRELAREGADEMARRIYSASCRVLAGS